MRIGTEDGFMYFWSEPKKIVEVFQYDRHVASHKCGSEGEAAQIFERVVAHTREHMRQAVKGGLRVVK